MTTKSVAAHLGTITGTAARGMIWAYETIDWAEVGAIVLHGLQVLIVLALLAGRATRRAWDALPAISEQLGRWWADVLAAPAQEPIPAVATLAAAREALERLIARLYPVAA